MILGHRGDWDEVLWLGGIRLLFLDEFVDDCTQKLSRLVACVDVWLGHIVGDVRIEGAQEAGRIFPGFGAVMGKD